MTAETANILYEIQRQLNELRSNFVAMSLKLTELTIEVNRNNHRPLQLIKTDGLIMPDEVSLTERELDLISLLRLGLANKCIARELGIAEYTVKSHVKNIMRKLKAKNRTEVACMLMQTVA